MRLPSRPSARAIGSRLTFANVTSGLCLAVLIGSGTAHAAVQGMVRSVDIIDNRVRSVDLRDNGVKSVDIQDGTLQAADFADGTLLVGPQGEQGETGPQGVRGETGETGPQGERGLTGLTGERGLQGEQGIQGETGAQGPQGEIGPQGEAGPQGQTGPQGIQGPAGAAGVSGYDDSATSATVAATLAGGVYSAAANATCSGGKVPLGGGYVLAPGGSQSVQDILVTQNQAASFGPGAKVWRVQAVSSEPFSLTSTAICASVSTS